MMDPEVERDLDEQTVQTLQKYGVKPEDKKSALYLTIVYGEIEGINRYNAQFEGLNQLARKKLVADITKSYDPNKEFL